MNLYRVYDTKAEAYQAPIPMATDAVAIRSAAEAVNGEESPMSRHPEDFILFRVANYTETNAAITPCDPVSITSFIDLVETQPTNSAMLTGVA